MPWAHTATATWGITPFNASSKGLPAKALIPIRPSNFTPRHTGPASLQARETTAASIAPTEWTPYFAGAPQGDVHDPGAAMLGGVCGHAGLFGNAYDVARLMYMLRMGGTYGGVDFFQPETIQAWTQRVDPDPITERPAALTARPTNRTRVQPAMKSVSQASVIRGSLERYLGGSRPRHSFCVFEQPHLPFG